MTYGELISEAKWKMDHNEITLGEYEEMIKPLNRDVDVLDKIRAEITENIEVFRMSDWETNNILADGLQMALNIIDGYREGEQE